MVNEDTQGNVSQLQAEVKRLKEQLAQLTSGQMPVGSFLTRGRVSTVFPLGTLRDPGRELAEAGSLSDEGGFPAFPARVSCLPCREIPQSEVDTTDAELWESQWEGEIEMNLNNLFIVDAYKENLINFI